MASIASAEPVKVAALALGLPVLQPGSLRKPDALALLRELAPDIIIVAAFGQILPMEVLQLPPLGCLNVNAARGERGVQDLGGEDPFCL